jgi:hypothetical protein
MIGTRIIVRGFGLLLGDVNGNINGDITIEGIVLIDASRERKRAGGREIA